jgi:hypothetical protein
MGLNFIFKSLVEDNCHLHEPNLELPEKVTSKIYLILMCLTQLTR